MKPNNLVLTFCSAVVLTVGCGKEPTTTQQLDKIETETKQTARDMKDYTYAQKTEFVEKMRLQLAELNRDLDQLSAKIEKGGEAARAEAKPKLQALREQAAKFNASLDDAKNATDSTWDSVKAGSRKAYGDLKDGFNQARQWVSDKIAP